MSGLTPGAAARAGAPSRIRSLWPAIATFGAVALIAVGLAVLVNQRNEDVQDQLFERDASAAFADIEREIESHLTVVEDVSSFADATWPGDIHEWRRYLEGRVTGGTHLGFTSTAGLVELIAADDLDAVIERERQADPSFVISEPIPLAPDQDRYVLMRTGFGDGVDTRGLELTSAVELLDLELPQPGGRMLVQSIEEAPSLVLSVLGVDAEPLQDNDIHGTNVLFVNPVGDSGSSLRGWVVIPADLSFMLTNAVESLEGDLSIAIRVPGASIDGDLGRYDGAGALPFADARFQSEQLVEFGGWSWTVQLWSDGAHDGTNGGQLTLGFGLVLAALAALLVENRRRHRDHLVEARIELSLQRTLAETDHLTGLLNRQGLAELRHRWSEQGDAAQRGRGVVFFVDLDGFKAINDEHGHAVGDEVLVEVARMLRSVARQNDVAVRRGGDEFVIVCPGLVNHAVIDERVMEFSEAIAAITQPVSVDASVGWSLAHRSLADELDELVIDADAAMYRNKSERHSGSRSWRSS